MKAIGDVVREFPAPRVTEASRGDIRCITDAAGNPLCLTAAELAAAGFRVTMGAGGRRVQQFGFCRDASGEWIYQDAKPVGETTEQMLERHRLGRAAAKHCAGAERKGTALFDE